MCSVSRQRVTSAFSFSIAAREAKNLNTVQHLGMLLCPDAGPQHIFCSFVQRCDNNRFYFPYSNPSIHGFIPILLTWFPWWMGVSLGVGWSSSRWFGGLALTEQLGPELLGQWWEAAQICLDFVGVGAQV